MQPKIGMRANKKYPFEAAHQEKKSRAYRILEFELYKHLSEGRQREREY